MGMNYRLRALILAAAVLLAACSGGETATPVVATSIGQQPLITQVVGPVEGAPAAGRLDAIHTAGVIRVGVSADYAPFESLDPNGERVGFDIALMHEIGRILGVQVEWADYPFGSLVGAVENGKVDAAISAFRYTPERDQQVDFTAAYYTIQDAFVGLESFGGQITAPEEAAAYKLGVQSGTAQERWVDENLVATGKLAETNLVRFVAYEEAISALKAGTIDLTMVDAVGARLLMEMQPGLKALFTGEVSGGPLHIIVPSGESALVEALNQAIAQLQSGGLIESMARQYIVGQ